MKCMFRICISMWIFMHLTKCYPVLESSITKPLKLNKGHTELVYPRWHSVDDQKINSQNTDRVSFVVLRTSIETFYIELKPNKDLLKSKVSDELGKNSTRNCHYHGNVLSHPNGVAAISMCEHRNRMVGTIIVRQDTFILRPLDHVEGEVAAHLKNSSSKRGIDPHVISKVENPLTQYCGVDHSGINVQETFNHLDEGEIDNHVRYRRSDDSKNSEMEYKVIETSVFVDYPLYRKFVVERRKLESELIDTVLAIINQVQIIYNYEPLKMKFKIVVVKLEILMPGKDAPDPADGDIDAYLDNFCNWQSFINLPEEDENHWDHSIMLSGYDLYKLTDGKQNKKVLGLAWVNGMCRPKHSCTINEGSSFEASFVIAHEMGHSLGMLHDGVGNDCDPKAYLMAEKTGPGRITWSKCSNDYLVRFFRKGRGKCLEDEDTNSLMSRSYKFDDELPGYRFDLDHQCKLSLGEDYRPHVTAKIPFNDVCRELWCVSGFWASVAHPALEGSTCSNGGRCIQGKCKGKKLNLSSQRSNSLVSIQKMIVDFLDKLKTAFRIILP